jgi:L-glyceraldehyde 3-phosphate reductase
LTDKYLEDGMPPRSRAAELRGADWLASRLTDARRRGLRQLNQLAHVRGQTLAQLSLAWILRQPGITGVVMGASSAAQIEENVATIRNLRFSEAELEAIDSISRAMEET